MISPTPIELQKAIVEVMVELTNNPAAADTLLPGFRIVRKPYSYQERSAMSLPLANAARKRRQAEWRAGVEATIRGIRCDFPGFTAYEIAAELNRIGEKPARGDKWTARGVIRLMRVKN